MTTPHEPPDEPDDSATGPTDQDALWRSIVDNYGDRAALRGVSLSAGRGELVVVVEDSEGNEVCTAVAIVFNCKLSAPVRLLASPRSGEVTRSPCARSPSPTKACSSAERCSADKRAACKRGIFKNYRRFRCESLR